NYWVYDVPYVNVIHLFSEMPLEGYFGYLAFGLMVWLMFIWAGKVFGFETYLLNEDERKYKSDV
ncbi:MAG: mechanosensitive ion channel protein MscS, partial [Thiomicrospira sp.]|nr:mechanosensitive ion channel protein MscS [Thiomicrospira sp.]